MEQDNLLWMQNCASFSIARLQLLNILIYIQAPIWEITQAWTYNKQINHNTIYVVYNFIENNKFSFSQHLILLDMLALPNKKGRLISLSIMAFAVHEFGTKCLYVDYLPIYVYVYIKTSNYLTRRVFRRQGEMYVCKFTNHRWSEFYQRWNWRIW